MAEVVRGAARLTKTTKAAARDLNDLQPENLATAEDIAELAAHNAPRRSGKLARSGRVGKRKTAATVYFGGGRVRYAYAIHFGVAARPGLRGPHNIKPNPFLDDAADKVSRGLPKYHLRKIKRILSKIKGE